MIDYVNIPPGTLNHKKSEVTIEIVAWIYVADLGYFIRQQLS